MGIEIETREYINEKTIEYGIGKLSDISSPKIQEQLIQIEKFLQKFRDRQKQLIEQIKEFNKLSVSSVSVGSNVPRSQINLNTNTLKLYIEKRISEIEKEDLLKVSKYEKLRSGKRENASYIDGLRQQIVDIFELKSNIESLEVENKRLLRQLGDRQMDIINYEKENSKLRRMINKLNNKKVVPFG
jgi:hypothetical protein